MLVGLDTQFIQQCTHEMPTLRIIIFMLLNFTTPKNLQFVSCEMKRENSEFMPNMQYMIKHNMPTKDKCFCL